LRKSVPDPANEQRATESILELNGLEEILAPSIRRLSQSAGPRQDFKAENLADDCS